MTDHHGGSGSFEREGAEALKLMEKALALLDDCDPAGHIGAHLDLAICRLREMLDPESAR